MKFILKYHGIPLRVGMGDHVMWHFDPKGKFPVKSVYHRGTVLRDAKLGRDVGPSSTSRPRRMD